ncbi:Cyclic di-GMP phosphodiesterase YfgF [Serratia fonticola]|uniref:Cyclic di-GMP phosphodiesterase YfgF n=1 Tax=Serratia fonticola TaxID=47917 RepID=A0A4U9UTR4_SERFO|nr:Cyclic di-GMP phosphodiesterase YfgF [Serratia fonticola]
MPRTRLKELRQLGCRIALDDFGTGYATYDRLKEAACRYLEDRRQFCAGHADQQGGLPDHCVNL